MADELKAALFNRKHYLAFNEWPIVSTYGEVIVHTEGMGFERPVIMTKPLIGSMGSIDYDFHSHIFRENQPLRRNHIKSW